MNTPEMGALAGRQPTGSRPGPSLVSEAAPAAETEHLALETEHQGTRSFTSRLTSRLNRVFASPYLHSNKCKRGFIAF